jgi:hypothetical protein
MEAKRRALDEIATRQRVADKEREEKAEPQQAATAPVKLVASVQ